VALTPSLVETVWALGLTKKLVGVTRFATWPAEVANLPKVGDFLQPDIETIARLKPHLVLLDTVQNATEAQLRAGGIATLSVRMESVEDVRTALLTVGKATGHEARARSVVAELDRDLERHAARARSLAAAHEGGRPRVLFAVDREPGSLKNLVVAGPGSYADELLTRAGAENVMHDARLRFFRAAPEEVLARAPTVILDATHGIDRRQALTDWQALPSVPAVKSGRVMVLSDPLFVTPGPRLGEALQRLIGMLYEREPEGKPQPKPGPEPKPQPEAG